MFVTKAFKPRCNIGKICINSTVKMWNLYITPLYSNVQITTCVLSLLPISPVVFQNPSKLCAACEIGRQTSHSFPYCFLNFASAAFVLLRAQNPENSEIREWAWNSRRHAKANILPSSLCQTPRESLHIGKAHLSLWRESCARKLICKEPLSRNQSVKTLKAHSVRFSAI